MSERLSTAVGRRTPGSDLRKLAARSAEKRTRFNGDDIMTVANVFLALLVVAILSIWPLTKWAIRSLKELEDEAQKWRIVHHD